jgi:hypothetical protein
MSNDHAHVRVGDVDDDLARWAADEVTSLGWEADALYVATSNAGHRESVEFWRAALGTGLAYANPRLFPWTLANSPAGAIAQAIGVRGPTYTLVGTEDAAVAAVEHAEDDLADGLVERALVIAIARDVEGRSRLAAALLDGSLSIGYRESLLTTFVECLTSSSSRPMATSRPSR